MNMPFYGAASITAAQRSQIINIENSKGPGMYDINKEKYSSSSPKWTIKSRINHGSCFQTSKQNLPPPGSYQISENLKQKVTLQNPNYRSQKHPKSTQKLTNLSDINIPATIQTKFGASFGYRDQIVAFKATNYSPGPIYNPIKTLEESRQLKIKNNCKGFGFGERNAIYKTTERLPGPGAYFEQEKENVARLNHSSTFTTFGKSSKNTTVITNPLGPGQYAPKISNNGSLLLNPSKGFKLKWKLPDAQRYINPNGPGSYDLPETKTSVGPRFNHFRHKSHGVEQNQMPSPFAYDCKRYPQMIDSRKGFSLGKRVNSGDLLCVHNPGPGAYEVQQDIRVQKPGGYMSQEILKKKKSSQDDCFGKYDPTMTVSSRRGPQYTFCCDQKSSFKAQHDYTLGPGHYRVKQKRTIEGYSMGSSQRFKQARIQRGYMKDKYIMQSTIGYIPSYLKNGKKSDLRAIKVKSELTIHIKGE